MSCMIIKQVLTLYVKYSFPFCLGLYPASTDVNGNKKLYGSVL